MVTEIRQNIATKEWVIIATERARRPGEFAHPRQELTADRPAWDPTCPFCPGNEEPPPMEQARIPADGPWQVRVLLNKYPALRMEGERDRHFEGIYRWLPGVGRHEIIVESPRHNTCPALMTPQEVARVIRTFQARGRDLAQEPCIEQIIYFQNHGPDAGTSLVHPHSQIVGLPVVPSHVRSRSEGARRYFDDTGRCVYCQMVREELASAERLIAVNEQFVAFIPYAAFSPFHTWILPRRHYSTFLGASPEEIDDLGIILRDVLSRIYVGLHDPDYNYVIRSAPVHDMGRDYLHWYVTVIPHVTKTAGFEMGSGMFINVTLPEASAAFLREVQPVAG